MNIAPVNRLPLDDRALDQLFREARTAHAFTPQPLAPGLLERLYELACWGPTAFNAQPARFVFVTSPTAKQRLEAALSPGNVAQTRSAPLTVIAAYDLRFYEHLPSLFKAYDAQPLYRDNADLALQTAQRNATLQGAYLLMAARALGLAVGPMSGFDADRINRDFFPEGRYRVNYLMNVGYPGITGPAPRDRRLSFAEAVTVL